MKTKTIMTLTAGLLCAPFAMAQSQIQPAPAAPLPTAAGPVSGATPVTNQNPNLNTNANPNVNPNGLNNASNIRPNNASTAQPNPTGVGNNLYGGTVNAPANPPANTNSANNANSGTLRAPQAPMAATSAANPIFTTGTSSTSGVRPVTPPTQNINGTNNGTGQSAASQPQTPRRNTTMTPGTSQLTAGNQGTSAYDSSVTRQIRERLTRNDLSMNARNVKIITVNGEVVLRGTVDSESERTTIQNIATGIVGSGRVKNETNVK